MSVHRSLVTNVVASVLVAAAVFAAIQLSGTPNPFGNHAILGSLTQIGQINGSSGSIPIVKVEFPNGANQENLTKDTIYLLQTPAGVETVPFDIAFGSNVNYYGYKYVSVDAAKEIAHRNDAIFNVRFPGAFFASAKARTEDSQHGNSLTTFETTNNIKFLATNVGAESMRLEANSLYMIIVNEDGPRPLSIHPAAVCGDGWRASAEECDDGNRVNGDGCSTMCEVENPGNTATGGNGEIEGPPTCGGLLGTQCPMGLRCVDKPNDSCDPAHGGADCTGICVSDGQSGGITGGSMTCATDRDCNGATEMCIDGQCRPLGIDPNTTCTNDLECPTGMSCLDGHCFLRHPESCSSTAQCETNQVCSEGRCVATCTNDAQCTNGAPCVDGICGGLGVTHTNCGDGKLDQDMRGSQLNGPSEQCDDMNQKDGDGCSSTCQIESGFTCTLPGTDSNCDPISKLCVGRNVPSRCTPLPVCGNGQREGKEQCDDGAANSDTTPGANCRTDCTLTIPLPIGGDTTTPATCAPTDCGPAPGRATMLCPDGINWNGPTGRCLSDASGSCHWEVSECPRTGIFDTCLPSGITSQTYVDGSHNVQQTLASQKAVCGSDGKLRDETGKEIRLYQSLCWGNPPANYQSLLAQQQANITQLQQSYNVIVLGCSPLIL